MSDLKIVLHSLLFKSSTLFDCCSIRFGWVLSFGVNLNQFDPLNESFPEIFSVCFVHHAEL